MNSVSRRFVVAALSLMALGQASTVHSQNNPPANVTATLFRNVRIFDGKSASLSAPSNVLVKGNIIERISTEPIAAEPGVTVIAGNGRTLMPGLIDAHWHAMLIRPKSSPGDRRRRRIQQYRGGRRGDGHADARLHHRPRCGWSRIRAEARHRRRAHRGTPYLSFGRIHHGHERTRRFPPIVGTAADDRRHAQPRRTDRRQYGRRQPRRGARSASASNSCRAPPRSS